MESVAITTEDVARTSREMSYAQWGVACVVMAGSMAAGALAVHYLGEPWGIGVVTAAAVDLALAVWLRMAGRLRTVGIRSVAGWVLEIAAALMTGYLNLGAAVFKGVDPHSPEARWLLGIAHSFLPVLLILVTVACGDAHYKLVHLRRRRDAAEQDARDAQYAANQARSAAEQQQHQDEEIRRANGELITAQDYRDKARELLGEAERDNRTAGELRDETVRVRAEIEAEVTATEAAKAKLAERPPSTPVVSKPAAVRRKGKTATPEQRRQWVRDELAAGRHPTPADVNRQFGPPDNGWRIVGDVKRELRAEVEKQRGLQLVENT